MSSDPSARRVPPACAVLERDYWGKSRFDERHRPFFLTLANGFRGAVGTISGFLDGLLFLKAARIRSLFSTFDNFPVALLFNERVNA